MRIVILLPFTLTIAGFVLSLLCIFAGNKPGFMEEYHIIAVNTSTLGHNLIPTNVKDSPISLKSPVGDLVSSVSGITGQINGIIGNAADILAERLGIHQWYGWHLRNFCEGMYKPSALDPSARLDVEKCSNPSSAFQFKIADILNEQLAIGPLHISLENLKWPDSIQENLDKLAAAYHATLAFYAIAIIFLGICIISSLFIFFGSSTPILLFNTWILLGLGSLCLLLSSIIITIAGSKASGIINDKGNKVGVYAYQGHKYLALSWCSVVVAFLAFVSFSVAILFGKNDSERKLTEKLSLRRKFIY